MGGGVLMMALAAMLSLAAVAASAAEFKPSPYLPPLLVFEVCRRLFLPSPCLTPPPPAERQRRGERGGVARAPHRGEPAGSGDLPRHLPYLRPAADEARRPQLHLLRRRHGVHLRPAHLRHVGGGWGRQGGELPAGDHRAHRQHDAPRLHDPVEPPAVGAGGRGARLHRRVRCPPSSASSEPL